MSQHFLPPPVADFYLITFTHSYPSSLLLSTVAETVSHFKGCESGFQKVLPPFNLSDAPWVSNQTFSHSFTGSCGRDVSVVKLLQVNRIFLNLCRADWLTQGRDSWKKRPAAGFIHPVIGLNLQSQLILNCSTLCHVKGLNSFIQAQNKTKKWLARLVVSNLFGLWPLQVQIC